MSLSEYSVLRHLSESPHGLMRMSELATACDMSLSGMTSMSRPSARITASSSGVSGSTAGVPAGSVADMTKILRP
jgi:hypothetical protein